MPGYESPATRAGLARGVLLVIVLADVAAVLIGGAEFSLLERLEAGEPVTSEELDASDRRQAAIGIVQLVLLLAGAVVFLRWFHLAYRNLLPLGAGALRYKPGWAIGAWFVPILNLWRPKQIANDLWRASEQSYVPGDTGAWRGGPVSRLLTAWWALFLVSTWLGQIAFRASLGADDVEGLKRATSAYLLADLADLAAALLAFVLVGRVTGREDERAAALARRGWRSAAS